MDIIVTKALVKLIKKNKYEPTHQGQKKLFNDLKKEKGFDNYSIILKELAGAGASYLGYIFLYSAYECEFYKEGVHKFAKFNKPLKLHEDSKIFTNFEENLKQANDLYGYVKFPCLKSDKKAIDKKFRPLEEAARKNLYSNNINFTNMDKTTKLVSIAFFSIPLLFLLILLPMDFSWEATECRKYAVFSDEDNKFLRDLGVGDENCETVQDGYSYPTMLKLMIFFAFLAHMGVTGSSLIEKVENKKMSKGGAIAIFLVSLPFVTWLGGFLLYAPLSGIFFLIGIPPAF